MKAIDRIMAKHPLEDRPTRRVTAWRASSLLMLLMLTASAPAGVVYEPNNDFASATPLAPGTLSVTDDIDGDIDPVDTLLGHFDPTFNTLLASDDDGSALGNGKASGLSGRPVHSNGGFYIAVTGSGDSEFTGSHSESGRYRVIFDTYASTGAPLGTFEFCESFSLGDGLDLLWLDPDPARIGGTVNVNIDNLYACGEGDPRDFWRFSGLLPGAPFAAEILAGGFDSLLGDFGDDGLLRDVDDNSGAGMLSRLTGLVPASGQLVLAVSGVGDDGFDGEHFQSGSYTLQVQVVPEPSSAAALLIGGCLSAWFVARGERRRRLSS